MTSENPIKNSLAGRWDRLALWILISSALVLAYGYITRIDKPNLHIRMALHKAVVSKDALEPYRHRVLVPWVTEALVSPLSFFAPREQVFLGVYALHETFALVLMLLSLYAWCRRFYEPFVALVGCLFVGVTAPMALKDHYFHPWSLLEPGLWTLGLLLIMRERLWALLGVTFLATLNRETGIFLPLLWGAIKVWDGKGWHRKNGWTFLALLVVSLMTLLGVGWVQGSGDPLHTPGELFLRNVSGPNLGRALLNGTLFLGAFWLFAVRGYRNSPEEIRRSAWVIPLYLLVVLVWGVWYEVRLLMPLYPILVPMALAIFQPRRMAGVSSRGVGEEGIEPPTSSL